MTAVLQKTISRAVPAKSVPSILPVGRPASARVQIQPSLKISKPNDSTEKEAAATAKKVLGMSPPQQSPHIARFAEALGLIQQRNEAATIARQGQGEPAPPANVSDEIQSSMGSGSPLPVSIRRFMEPRFQTNFENVRIHTGDKAASLNTQLRANAFTIGNQIFFGKDRFRPDSSEGKELLAHELSHTLQQTPALQRSSDKDEKRMYRTRDGQMVELPPDLTEQEAAQLEAEGKAAEKQLGKGPPPKPVPDVRKPVRKAAKKDKPRRTSRGAKGEKAGAKAAPKAGAVATALLKAVGPGKVAQYLAAKGAPVLFKGIGMLRKLKQNEQTHDDSGEKLKQSEKAVVIPASEEQSKSNSDQVNFVDGRPKPAADESRAHAKLTETLQQNIPKSLEEVDNFQRDKKAQHMGADVMTVVQGDKNAVISTFADLSQTPPPTPTDHVRGDLPPQEVAPATTKMNLGQAAIAPLQKEHTDCSSYTKEADGRLKEEGVTQEQLDMVDNGELAEANREKKGLEQKVKAEPVAIQKFAVQEAGAVDSDLQQEEKNERDAIRAKRRSVLGGTSQKQKGTKTALEKKREEVANKINGFYKTAQDSVTKKLAKLETDSMKRFDAGNTTATKTFEDTVKREFEAYKADRYSGWFGWARRAKDWLLGMEDLPRVKRIFDTNRTIFVSTINQLVADITADNKRVIQECKDELAKAKKEIKEFVDGLEPGLADIGKKAAQEMNDRLNDLDQSINRKEEELQNKLKDKQTAAIKAIDEKIEKMKEAMSGALAKLGKLLLWAAKKFFTWALGKFGMSLSTIESIISKGVAVLKAIFTGPIQFVKRLVSAAGTGFANFGKNFLTHLKNAIFEWLTGSLEGLVLPETWNLRGILSVVFQMLGITYQNIRAHLLKLVPEPVVKTLETGVALVKTLITEGPMAAWEQLKDIAGEMKDAFVDAVKGWIKWKIVQKAIETVLAMFIPGAGIVRAIIAIYDTIVFFIQKAKQIIEMIGSFLGSIAEIAAGNLGAAAAALENGLARGLKLVISFLAKFLRLDGITQKIREAIQTVRGKVDNVIAKVASWIVSMAKKVVGAVKETATTLVEKLTQWWKKKIPFQSVEGGSHSVYFKGEEDSVVVMVASNETDAKAFLAAKKKASTDAKEKKAIGEAQKQYQSIIEQKTLLSSLQDRRRKAIKESVKDDLDRRIKREDNALYKLFVELSGQLAALDFSDERDSMARSDVNIGTANMPKNVNAIPLTEVPGNTRGSPPVSGTEVPAGWADVKTIDSTNTLWVKAHLISETFHGPGREGNLVPTRKTTNAQMSVAEGDVKSYLRTGNIAAWYNVDVTYHRGHTDARATPFPKSIVLTWGKAIRTGSKWTRGSEVGRKPITSIEAPDFSGAKVVEVNINSSSTGRDAIINSTGVTDRYAMNLIDERNANGPFRSFSDLDYRMKLIARNSGNQSASLLKIYHEHNLKIRAAEKAGKLTFK